MATGDTNVTNLVASGYVDTATLKINGTASTATATELSYLAGVTPGTAAASKVAILCANKNLDTLVIADGGLYLGSGAGTAVGATAAELNTAADLSANGGLVRIKKLALTAQSAETDTTFDLPAKSVVLDVWLDVTTAEVTGTTKTLDVGLLTGESGGDPDGFLDGVSTASTGLRKGVPTITTGSNEVYFASTTRGVFFEKFTAGTDAAGDVGTVYDSPHLSDAVTAKSVTYTPGSAQTEFVGVLYIMYMEIG